MANKQDLGFSKLMNTQTITIIKQNHLGEPVFSWEGELVSETTTSRMVRAYFSGAEAVAVDKVTFRKGDLMLERYYTDRWYNAFEVHDGLSDQVKCWYINLCYPAQFGMESITWQDLALELAFRELHLVPGQYQDDLGSDGRFAVGQVDNTADMVADVLR